MTEETKAKALAILDRRDVSRKMLTDKLTEKGVTPEEARECADWLCSIGVVNDERFAGLVVRHYARKGYGAQRIREELYRRGIDRELWDAAFEEMPEQDDTVYTLFTRRMGSATDEKSVQRAAQFLLRRGFSWEEIRSAMERYSADIEETL